MKNLLRIIAMIAITLSVAFSAEAAKKDHPEQVTKVYKCDIDCHSCAQKIMNTLPFKKGIKDVKVDVEKKTVTVKYDSTKSNDMEIIKSLEAIDIKADISVK